MIGKWIDCGKFVTSKAFDLWQILEQWVHWVGGGVGDGALVLNLIVMQVCLILSVCLQDTPGFVVNRLLVPYLLESVRLFERGKYGLLWFAAFNYF